MRLAQTLVLGLALSGCAYFQADAIGDKERTLAAAGFEVRPLDSPARATMAATLPPDRLSQRVDGADLSYLYPDPVKCHCLYIGGQAAYTRYAQLAIFKNIARDQIDAAVLGPGFGWDWGPWGYGPGVT